MKKVLSGKHYDIIQPENLTETTELGENTDWCISNWDDAQCYFDYGDLFCVTDKKGVKALLAFFPWKANLAFEWRFSQENHLKKIASFENLKRMDTDGVFDFLMKMDKYGGMEEAIEGEMNYIEEMEDWALPNPGFLNLLYFLVPATYLAIKNSRKKRSANIQAFKAIALTGERSALAEKKTISASLAMAYCKFVLKKRFPVFEVEKKILSSGLRRDAYKALLNSMRALKPKDKAEMEQIVLLDQIEKKQLLAQPALSRT